MSSKRLEFVDVVFHLLGSLALLHVLDPNDESSGGLVQDVRCGGGSHRLLDLCVSPEKGGLIPKALAVRGIDNSIDMCVNVCEMYDVMSRRNQLRSVDRSCLHPTCHVAILGIFRRSLPGSITQCVKSNEEHASFVSSSNKTNLGSLIESLRTLPVFATT